MFTCVVNTDFNGIVIFEPYRLAEFFGGSIAPGTDLFTEFRSSDLGDRVLEAGIVIPILAIDDAGYTIEILVDEKSVRPPSDIKFSNGIFPLRIRERLVVADLAVLKEWESDLGWIDIPVPAGIYAANVRGFQRRDNHDVIVDCGYEVSLQTVTEMPVLTGTTDINARVFD
jgi:hypothetical protein